MVLSCSIRNATNPIIITCPDSNILAKSYCCENGDGCCDQLDYTLIWMVGAVFLILISYVIISICCKSSRSSGTPSNAVNVEDGSNENAIKPLECPFCRNIITAPPTYSQANLCRLDNPSSQS
uniref:Uncharacterized protein n=1 Tax=Acrobeloides nanus TaxID=290746 RepID=A0A914D949_9BILA